MPSGPLFVPVTLAQLIDVEPHELHQPVPAFRRRQAREQLGDLPALGLQAGLAELAFELRLDKRNFIKKINA